MRPPDVPEESSPVDQRGPVQMQTTPTMSHPEVQDEALRQLLAGGPARARHEALVSAARTALDAEPPDLARAEALCAEAVALRPSDSTALRPLAEALFQQGREDEVDAHFAAAAAYEPGLAWHLSAVLAAFWHGHGDRVREEAALRLGVEQAPDDARCLVALARFLMLSGRFEEAEAALEEGAAPSGAAIAAMLAEVRAHREAHERIQQGVAARLLLDEAGLPGAAAHLRWCMACQRRIAAEAGAGAQLRERARLAAGALGALQVPCPGGHATLELTEAETVGETVHWRFAITAVQVEGLEPAPEQWVLEAWTASAAGIDVPLSMAAVTAGVIALPLLVGGQVVEPHRIEWRLTQAEDAGDDG